MSGYDFRPGNPGVWGQAPDFAPGNPGVWGKPGSGTDPRRRRRPRPPGATATDFLAPSAESEADRIMAEILAEFNLTREAARREAEQAAQLEMNRAKAFSEALVALGSPALIGDIYSRSAGSIGNLAQGFSGEMRGLAEAQAAEQANMVSGTGQEGAVRNAGVAMSDVLFGKEGFIPGRSLEQTGSAFASQAALQPGFALQFGQQAASDVMRDFTENVLPDLAAQEAAIRSKRPSIVAELKDKQKAEARDLFQMGLITQREFAKRMGVKDWRKFPNVRAGSESSWELREVNGGLYAIDPKRGVVKTVIPGPGPKPEIRSQGGYIWERDPATGKWMPVGGTGPAPRGSSGGGSGRGSAFQNKVINGRQVVFDPNTGVFYDPATGRPVNPNAMKGGPRKPLTQSALKAGIALVKKGKNGWWALQANPDDVLSSAELRQVLQNAGYKVGRLSRLTPEEQDKIGIGYYFDEPLEVYMELVQMGFAPGRAKRLVRSYWPNFGTPGKNPEPGARDAPGQVSSGPPGSNNVSASGEWGGSKSLADRFAQVAVDAGGLSVGSTKRNTRNTAGGGISDHWSGSTSSYAYDLSGTVANMDKAAKALMKTFGVKWDGRSPIIKNFYSNGYRIQVLYRAIIDGVDHFNHIHVGVRREGGGTV